MYPFSAGDCSDACFTVTCGVEGIRYECLYLHYYMHFEDDEQTGFAFDSSE